MKICVGGTFNRLHKGHISIIRKAFEYAGTDGTVFIGLATGDLTKNKKNVKSLDTRKKELKKYLLKEGFNDQAVIVPINNKYGLTLDEDFDAIVISPETEKIAIQINRKRVLKGKKPLEILKTLVDSRVRQVFEKITIEQAKARRRETEIALKHDLSEGFLRYGVELNAITIGAIQ